MESPFEPARQLRPIRLPFLVVADDGFDGGAETHLALDGLGHAALLAGVKDFKPVGERGIVIAVAGIGENAADTVPDGPLHIGNDGCQGMAVIGQCFGRDTTPLTVD